MTNKCTPRPTANCGPVDVVTPGAPADCPVWEICLPFGGRMWSDGRCVKVAPGNPPADGVYGKVVVSGGCIVGVEKADLPLYVAPPCSQVPADCASGDTEESNLCNPSATAGNLYQCDTVGRPLVRCNIRGGDNVTVSGDGTSGNPFVVAANISTEAFVVKAGNTGVEVAGSGTGKNPLKISHATGGYQGTINGMTFDQFGHLESYDDPGASGINGIAAGYGIDVQMEQKAGIATIGIAKPAHGLEGTYRFGGFDVQLDTKNLVFNINRILEVPAGTYAWGQYDVEVNEYGSVVSITDAGAPGTEIFALLPAPAAGVVRRNVTFTLRHTAPIVIDIATVADRDWAGKVQVRLDEVVQNNIMRLSTAATAETVINGGQDSLTAETTLDFSSSVQLRVVPSGVYQAGQHVLTIHSADGFPSDFPLSVSIRPVKAVDSVENLTADEIWD